MHWTGGCLCGALRYEVEAEPLWICHCHCDMCKKHSGAAFMTYIGFPKAAFRWTRGSPKLYDSSGDAKRGFCATCGSSVTFHRVHETSLALGGLDHPERLEVGAQRPVYADNHIFIGEQVPWLKIDDALDRYEGLPPAREDEMAVLAGREIAPCAAAPQE
ncbi:MAG: GFA family protein [Pseudomonadota bacterium]